MTRGYQPVNPSGETFNGTKPSFGLTIREQFAMAAMQGLLANEHAYQRGVKFQDDMPLSRQAVNMADALLAELERTK